MHDGIDGWIGGWTDEWIDENTASQKQAEMRG
jgi:hypothetical protein